jgi:uracil-DNA glycosylase
LEWGEPPAAPANQLQDIEPERWRVSADWAPLVADFWASTTGQSLRAFLQHRQHQGAVIYPSQPLRAMELTPLDEVRVVILGQDPYHGPGQAEGLAFSVAPGVKTPPSLRNLFKERHRDLGLPLPTDGSLERWARQGVLLLNTCLTVEDGQPASHAGQGWESLTDAVIRQCNATGTPKAFLLWGAHAQKKAASIDGQRHHLLCANHPSPLSANRGPVPFMGCGHLGAANRWLSSEGLPPVAW